MNTEINKSALKKMLKKEGFFDINDDDVFQSDNIIVFIDADGEEGIRISFGHSEEGYHYINNPTIEQINRVILVYKEAESRKDNKSITELYGSIILRDFEKYLNKKLKKKWKNK